jgi:hypothetical protein
MTNAQTIFTFDVTELPTEPAASASVPQRLESKRTLMEAVAELLRFPDYFGENWDAFEECMRDLSWMPPGPIVLVHSDVPLQNDLVSAKTYLSILSGAVGKMLKSPDRKLIVAFPGECRQQIEWLLRSQRAQEARHQ